MCGVVAFDGGGVLAHGIACDACVEQAVGLFAFGPGDGGVERVCGVEAVGGRGVLAQVAQRGACTAQATSLVVLGVWEGGVEGSCGVEAVGGRGVLAHGVECGAGVEQAVGLVAFGSREACVKGSCGVEAVCGRGVLASLERLSGVLKQRRRDGVGRVVGNAGAVVSHRRILSQWPHGRREPVPACCGIQAITIPVPPC